jgi:PRTRC genetic system protein C
MSVKIEALGRVFLFNGVKLPDPNPDFTVEQVRDIYCQKTPAMQFHPKSM